MAENVLSPEEINALLEGVDSGAVDAGQAPHAPGEAVTYDLVGNDRIVRGRLPALEKINEIFTRRWRNDLYAMLHRSVAVTSRQIDMARFTDYMHGLSPMSSINLIRVKPLRGTAMIVVQPSLVFAVVDNFFGGLGKFPAQLGEREFTATEMRVISLLLEQVFAGMTEAWQSLMPLEFEYINSETNPHFANILTPREHIVVCRFQVDLEGGSGELQVILPWAMLEPVRDLLSASTQGENAERDEKWSQALQQRLLETHVTPLAVMAEIRTTLGKLLKMKAGDILPIDIKDSMPLRIEGVPVFQGRLGVSNGKHAIKITEVPASSSAPVAALPFMR